MITRERQLKIVGRLKMYRRKKRFSQKEATRKLKLQSPSLLSRWENGVSTPNLTNLAKLTLLYNASFEELYYDFLEDLKEKYPALQNS